MSIFPNGKLPIYADAQLYYIRRARIQADAQAAHEAENRKLMAQEIAKATQAKQGRKFMPKWDELPNCIGAIAQSVFGSNATDEGTLALIRSMLPRYIEATGTGNRIEVAPIIDRIKYRLKFATQYGQSLAVFKDEHIDESTKADDLTMLNALSRNGNNTGDNDTSKEDMEQPKGNIATTRAKVYDSWIAYKSAPDNFTSDPITRKKGEKPTYEEYIRFCGNNVIALEKTLNEILEEARKQHESPKDTLTRLIQNEQKNRRSNTK